MLFLTGATGFMGNALLACLLENKMKILVGVRKKTGTLPHSVQQVIIGDLSVLSKGSLTLQGAIFDGVEVVIHTAARVHVMNEGASDSWAEFRKINRDATLVLARLAAESGVKRFVFISSIKVNGEMTSPCSSFKPNDVYVPDDHYGLSKYEAEQGLLALAKETGMEVVIIRPPLVYGSDVKANFASMMKWMSKSIPLPFGAIHNKRSLVALDNLVDFIALCADRKQSPKAANEVFLISDGEDVSTTQLLRKVAKAQNNKAWLIPIPTGLMTFAAKLIGKGDVANRLFGSLQVDSSKAHDLLGWKPITTMDEQLQKMVKGSADEKSI